LSAQTAPTYEQEQELNSIITEMKSPENFERMIPKLYAYLQEHPEINLDDYIQTCSGTF